MKFTDFLTIISCTLWDMFLFNITKQIYCNKYYFKKKKGCTCWSCRFTNDCIYSKWYKNEKNDIM